MFQFRSTLSAAFFSLLLATASARADTFTTGNYYSGDQNNFSTGLISFSLYGGAEIGAAGNIAGSSGVVGGKSVVFSEVFCIDIPDYVYLDSTYQTLYDRSGAVDGAPVNNAGEIAWLILNLAPQPSDMAANEGLQAAIWSVEYGQNFAMNLTPGANLAEVDTDYTADLAALGNQTAPVSSVYWISPEQYGGGNAQAQVGLVNRPLSSPQISASFAPTPEPNSLLLLGTGLSAMGGVLSLRRRKTVSA